MNFNNSNPSTKNEWCCVSGDGLTISKVLDKRFAEFIAPYPELANLVLNELTKGPSSAAENLVRNYRTVIGTTAAISEGRFKAGDYNLPPSHPLIPQNARAFTRLGLTHPDVEI